VIPSAPAPSAAADHHRIRHYHPPPQPLCFGSLPPSLLAPGSHLPLFPFAPWPSTRPVPGRPLNWPSSVFLMATTTASTKKRHLTKDGEPPHHSKHDGCSTICPQGYGSCNTGAPSAVWALNGPGHRQPHWRLGDRRNEHATFVFEPGTHFQNIVLENYFCPVVRPLLSALSLYAF
jgi:hypothetical protein